MKKWNKLKEKVQSNKKNNDEQSSLQQLIEEFKQSSDFIFFHNPKVSKPFNVGYFKALIDVTILHRDILANLTNLESLNIEDIQAKIPVEVVKLTDNLDEIKKKALRGFVLLQFIEEPDHAVLVRAEFVQTRDPGKPEVEFSVIGPKETFVENYETNLNLLRRRLPSVDLRVERMIIGEISQTKIAIIYLNGIANQENVNTVKQRIKELKVPSIIDVSTITQYIEDSSTSIFPQLIDTERPDRTTSAIVEGKIAILCDGSPQAVLGPSSLVEFFSAFEDYFMHWIVASAFRLIRFFSVLFSILATPVYVALLTYHYEILPQDLMGTLLTSRRNVPFPPILEALILELAIELLREAGARLPTKIGQTIGIVGGIVIGTAAVQAGLTSNVLLIIIALGALASFTTPVYKMGNTIRLIRFPLLFSAQFLGLLGISLAFSFILAHLLQLKSLGRPYLEPFFPTRMKDFRDSVIRLPNAFQAERPGYLRPEQKQKFSLKKAIKKKDKKDIYE